MAKIDEISPEMDGWLRGQFDEWLADSEVKPGWMTRNWLAAQAAHYLKGDLALARDWVDKICVDRGLTFKAEGAINGWLDEFRETAESGELLSVPDLVTRLVDNLPIKITQATREVEAWASSRQLTLANRSKSVYLLWAFLILWLLFLIGSLVHGVNPVLAKILLVIAQVTWFTFIIQSRVRNSGNARKRPDAKPNWLNRLRALLCVVAVALFSISTQTVFTKHFEHLLIASGLIIAISLILLLVNISRRRCALFQIRAIKVRFDNEIRPTLWFGWGLVIASLTADLTGLLHPNPVSGVIGFFAGLISLIFQAAFLTSFDRLGPDGETALTLAAKHDQPDQIRRLLRAGANPSVKNAWRETPLELFARMNPPFDPNL